MRRSIITGVLAALVIAAPSARIKVRSDYDKKVDFSALKTWAWPADGFGQVKMALTQDDDPESIRKPFEPTLVASVEEALTKKKLLKAPAGTSPDFLVAYFALISVSTSAQTFGQFIAPTMEWGIPPFQGSTQSLKIFEQGSLVIDVMTPGKEPMWRGVGQAEMHRERPQAEREKTLRAAVFDILKEFPPKKK